MGRSISSFISSRCTTGSFSSRSISRCSPINSFSILSSASTRASPRPSSYRFTTILYCGSRYGSTDLTDSRNDGSSFGNSSSRSKTSRCTSTLLSIPGYRALHVSRIRHVFPTACRVGGRRRLSCWFVGHLCCIIGQVVGFATWNWLCGVVSFVQSLRSIQSIHK